MLEYELHPELSLILLKGSGMVDFAQIQETIQTYMGDERYSNDFSGVTDFRNADVQLSLEEIEQISNFVAINKVAKGRWCMLLTNPKETAIGMFYANKIQEEHPIQLFSTLKAASEYMGLDLTQLLKSSKAD